MGAWLWGQGRVQGVVVSGQLSPWYESHGEQGSGVLVEFGFGFSLR
jgi:hypothetical protein